MRFALAWSDPFGGGLRISYPETEALPLDEMLFLLELAHDRRREEAAEVARSRGG